MADSADTLPKPPLDRLLTVYGRKPVRETLLEASLPCHALHLAHSNREAGIVREIRQLAQQRAIPVREYSREALSRISKNGRQDQGVAWTYFALGLQSLHSFYRTESPGKTHDCSHWTASPIHKSRHDHPLCRRRAGRWHCAGQKRQRSTWPTRHQSQCRHRVSCADTVLFGTGGCLDQCRGAGATICALDSGATQSLFTQQEPSFCVYVLGNESDGVSPQVQSRADRKLVIPMHNGVESLNVAVTASLIAFLPMLSVK